MASRAVAMTRFGLGEALEVFFHFRQQVSAKHQVGDTHMHREPIPSSSYDPVEKVRCIQVHVCVYVGARFKVSETERSVRT